VVERQASVHAGPDPPRPTGGIDDAQRTVGVPFVPDPEPTGDRGLHPVSGVVLVLERELVAALARTPKLTRGPKPKRALVEHKLAPEHIASEPTTAGLVATARAIQTPLQRVAIQLYSDGQDRQLVEHFEQRGLDVDCVAPYVYASASDDDRVAALIGELAAGRVDAIAFTSKAQVQRLMDVAQKRNLQAALQAGLERTKVAAIGPVVASELANEGIRVDTMPDDSYSMKPLVTKICGLLAAQR
jgi:uroporphyrinogen-III synthase